MLQPRNLRSPGGIVAVSAIGLLFTACDAAGPRPPVADSAPGDPGVTREEASRASRILASAGNSRMSPLEQGQLRERAVNFVRNAARSEIESVSADAIEALVQIDPEDGPRHVRPALSSESALIRFKACIALGELRDADYMDRFVRLLSDPHPHVRLAAAFALYRCGDRSQGWVLSDALKKSDDERLRCQAAFLIGRIGESDASKLLQSIARDSRSPVRLAVQAVEAMAYLGDERAVEELSQYAQGDSVARVIALQSMVELAHPATRDALLYRLEKKDEYLENRLIAARALGRLRMPNGFKLAIACLEHASRNPEDPEEAVRVRSLAALALGDIGDARALPLLKRIAETENDARLQLAAACAICRIVEPPVGSKPPSRGLFRPAADAP